MSAERATVRAVVKYAEHLRAVAERQMAADPYAKPYYPTTAAARTLCKRIANQLEAQARAHGTLIGSTDQEIAEATAAARASAPAAAIEHLRRKAAVVDRKHREENIIAERALARHQRRQATHARDLEAMRAGRTLGQRLDATLAHLSTIASAPAAKVDSNRVRGGERNQQPPWAGDPHGYARDRAYQLVQHIEALLDAARNRDISKAA